MRLISSIKLSKEIVSVMEVINVMVLIEGINPLFKFFIKITPNRRGVNVYFSKY
jgi:hypothetical protein